MIKKDDRLTALCRTTENMVEIADIFISVDEEECPNDSFERGVSFGQTYDDVYMCRIAGEGTYFFSGSIDEILARFKP